MRSVLITGPIGAGKTAFTRWMTKISGEEAFCADQQAKKLLQPESPCYNKLKRALGPQCLNKEGGFDHKLLADMIFKQAEKRKILEALIHPLVKKAFESFAQRQKALGFALAVCEAPPVSQSFISLFDIKILIACPLALRKTRLIKKGWTEENISLRESAQIPIKALQNKMDFVIDNSGTMTDLKAKAKKLLGALSL